MGVLFSKSSLPFTGPFCTNVPMHHWPCSVLHCLLPGLVLSQVSTWRTCAGTPASAWIQATRTSAAARPATPAATVRSRWTSAPRTPARMELHARTTWEATPVRYAGWLPDYLRSAALRGSMWGLAVRAKDWETGLLGSTPDSTASDKTLGFSVPHSSPSVKWD